MIDDALKATRTIHRLLIAVGVVCLVFLVSLPRATREERLASELDALQSAPFDAYGDFIAERIEVEVGDTLAQRREELNTGFDNLGAKVFGIEQITTALCGPLHVGRVRPEDTALSNLGTTTLDHLDELFLILDAERNVQIVLPVAEPVITEVVSFLGSETSAGGPLGEVIARVEDLRVWIPEQDVAAETFIDGESATVYDLSFTVDDGQGAAPVFEATLAAEIIEIPGTSFGGWLRRQEAFDGLVPRQGENAWLADAGFSTVERRTNVAHLERALREDIENARAKNRRINLAGVSIPGSLAVFAVPFALVGLVYALANHIGHLRRIVQGHEAEFRQFAWMPLVLNRFWRWEAGWSILGVPILALLALAWRRETFDVHQGWTILSSIVGLVAAIPLGILSIDRLGELRGSIASDSKREQEETAQGSSTTRSREPVAGSSP
jgi:hypothetical protein